MQQRQPGWRVMAPDVARQQRLQLPCCLAACSPHSRTLLLSRVPADTHTSCAPPPCNATCCSATPQVSNAQVAKLARLAAGRPADTLGGASGNGNGNGNGGAAAAAAGQQQLLDMDDFRNTADVAYDVTDVPDSVIDMLAELRCYLQVRVAQPPRQRRCRGTCRDAPGVTRRCIARRSQARLPARILKRASARLTHIAMHACARAPVAAGQV